MSIPIPGSEPLITHIEADEVSIANIPMKVANGTVSFSLINTAGHKILQGDPGPDAHPTDSLIIQRDATGGGQVLFWRGDQDRGRFWDGDSDTDHTELISLPPDRTSFSGPNSNLAIVHGQYPNSIISKVYASWGNQLCQLNVAGTAFTAVGTYTTDLPVAHKSVNYAIPGTTALKMYIPCGPSFHTWDGTTLTRIALPAIDFVVWEQKLFRLTPDGHLYFTNTDPTTLGGWTLVGTLCGGEDPRHLTVFYDRNNILTVYVITSDKAFALDFTDQILFETDQFWPRHPNFGLGVCRWRADLYVSAGTGIQRQSNGFINAVGPDHDSGLPKELAGFIVDLEPAFNNYFALIQGESQAGTAHSSGILHLTGEEAMQASIGTTNSSLLGFSGLGWRKWWQGQGVPSTVFVANPPGEYWVYWGAGSKVYRMPLTMNYYNPREAQTFPFAPTSEHITVRYNWGWVNIPKIAKRLDCNVHNCSAAGGIQVYYRFDDGDAPWTLLANINENGRHTFRFGDVPWDNQTLHYGVVHEWIQLRFVFTRDPATPKISPYLEWFALVGRKFLTPVRTWRFTVDLTQPIKGYTYEDAAQLLVNIAATPGPVPFVLKNKLYMADMTVQSGADKSGHAPRGQRTITLEEFDEVVQLQGIV